jgi:hypothetical protein
VTEDIIYKNRYLSKVQLESCRLYFQNLNDSFSNGPKEYISDNGSHLLKEGCWDRPLRLENPDNPIHQIIEQLKMDLGDFVIHTCSIRYLAYPFVPHSDIRSSEWMIENNKKYKPGYTILIPLSWKTNYKPGTAFFDCPPKEGQEMYVEQQAILPKFQNQNHAKNFGIKKLVAWQHPGDLIAWKNYRFHCSMTDQNYNYSDSDWCKEFISIETFFKKF